MSTCYGLRVTPRVARKPKDAYQHGNLREALIQAGLQLLTENGPAGLSLRAAAQLAGVSHAAPYRHFADKNALVAAIAEEGFRLLTAAMAARRDALPRDAGVRDRLEALGEGYLAFATGHPAYLAVIFGGVLCDDDVPAGLREAGGEAYATLRNVVAEGVASRELRSEDVEQVTLAAWSLVHGLATLLNNGAVRLPDRGPTQASLTRAIVRMLEDGIARPNRGTKPRKGRKVL